GALATLASAVESLRKLDASHVDRALLTKTGTLSSIALVRWSSLAAEATKDVSAFQRWVRFFKRRRYKQFVQSLGEEPSEDRMAAVRAILELEKRLRPLRVILWQEMKHFLVDSEPTLATPRDIEMTAKTLIAAL